MRFIINLLYSPLNKLLDNNRMIIRLLDNLDNFFSNIK